MLFIIVKVFWVVYPYDVSIAEGCRADLSPRASLLHLRELQGQGGATHRRDGVVV